MCPSNLTGNSKTTPKFKSSQSYIQHQTPEICQLSPSLTLSLKAPWNTQLPPRVRNRDIASTLWLRKVGTFPGQVLNRIFTPTYVLLHEPLKTCIFITYSCMSQKKSGKKQKNRTKTQVDPGARCSSNEEFNKKKNKTLREAHLPPTIQLPNFLLLLVKAAGSHDSVCVRRGAEWSRAERSGVGLLSVQMWASVWLQHE